MMKNWLFTIFAFCLSVSAWACPGCAGGAADGKSMNTVLILGIFILLTYIPFYERFYPIFAVQESNETTKVHNYSYKFNLRQCDEDCDGRQFNEKTHEISFGRFTNLLRAFANFFESTQR